MDFESSPPELNAATSPMAVAQPTRQPVLTPRDSDKALLTSIVSSASVNLNYHAPVVLDVRFYNRNFLLCRPALLPG